MLFGSNLLGFSEVRLNGSNLRPQIDSFFELTKLKLGNFPRSIGCSIFKQILMASFHYHEFNMFIHEIIILFGQLLKWIKFKF